MVTKNELELERQTCHNLALRAITAERQDQYAEAIHLALTSLPHLDAGMQYERKHMKIDCPPLPTVELLFRCAPPLFHRQALDDAEAFLAERRRIDKDFARDLKDQLADARERMRTAARLWAELQAGTDASATADVVPIRNYWERTGLIVNLRTNGRNHWQFRTQMDEPTQGKCSHCGYIVTAKKVTFLDKTRCPKCMATVPFVILGPATRTNP